VLATGGYQADMSGPTIAGGAFVLGLVAFAFVVGAPIFAVPIVLVALAILGLLELRARAKRARSMEEFRDEAAAEKVEFTARDKETLA
jgi:Na+/H+ antiporter NhaD/arsenite permease-like protein